MNEPHRPAGITADDALRLTAELGSWLTQTQTHRVTAATCWNNPTGPLTPEQAEQLDLELRDAITATDPIWCDPAMGDLLVAAAATVPTEQLRDPVRFSPGGVVLFARPLPVDWTGAHATDGHLSPAHANVQAVTWMTVPTGGINVIAWTATGPITGTAPGGGRARFCTLIPAGAVEWAHPNSPASTPQQLLPLLHSLAGLLRTPTVLDELAPVSKRATTAARRHGIAEAQVRRVYLRHPETGAEELAALRAARAGTTRGHWVRGHWKRQWHPSVEEHRWAWIDGYARGDWTKGAVPGDKVLIARGDATPQDT